MLPRLSESTDGSLHAAIGDLRAHQPDVAELASLVSRLALQGVAVTAATQAGSVAGKLWKKWALLGGGAASGAALLWLSSGPPAASPTPATPRSGGVVSMTSVSSPGLSAPLGVGRQASRPDVPQAAQPELAPTPASTVATNALPELPRIDPDAAAVERPESQRPEAAPTPPSTTPSSTAPRSRALTPPAGATSPAPLEGAAPAVTEIELLRDARLALRQSPGRALELTEAHARAFPRGKLSQERELIAISALVAVGRRTAALSRASRFNEAFPESPYRRQITELLR
jgi:hypothetical protein